MRKILLLALSPFLLSCLNGFPQLPREKVNFTPTTYAWTLWGDVLNEAVEDLNHQIGCEVVHLQQNGVPVFAGPLPPGLCGVAYQYKLPGGSRWPVRIEITDLWDKPEEAYYTIQHEIGHILGLEHEPVGSGTLMAEGACNSGPRVLSEKNRVWLNKRYCEPENPWLRPYGSSEENGEESQSGAEGLDQGFGPRDHFCH